MVLSHIATISTQVFSTKLQQRVVGCLGNSLGLEPMIYGGWSMIGMGVAGMIIILLMLIMDHSLIPYVQHQ